jgi:cytochrome c oxidase subunit 3
MPAIFTPPGIDPRHKLSEGDNGAGRRPPTDKRTGGGGNGEGDNWDDRPVGSRGPRERLAQFRIGIASALAADAMFFIALIACFLVTKSNFHIDPRDRYVNEWLPLKIPSILWINTVVLLLSSLTAEVARRAMFREHDAMDEWIGLGKPISRRAGIWLAVTLLLGTVFLAGQTVAWQQLSKLHIFLRTNPSSKFFYLITVTHAVHLFLGIAGLIAALVGLRASRQLASRQILVDTTVWYWHAMGALWIILFVLLEFFQ